MKKDLPSVAKISFLSFLPELIYNVYLIVSKLDLINWLSVTLNYSVD